MSRAVVSRAASCATESPVATSYRKKNRPRDQNAVRPSGDQPMNSPATRVSFRTGITAPAGFCTEMRGAESPTSGTVTR